MSQPRTSPPPCVAVPLEDIIAGASAYRLSPLPQARVELARSLAGSGQHSPLIVHQRGDGGDGPPGLHLVDGYRRLAAAHRLGWARLECRILPADTPPELLLALLASCRHDLLSRSAVARVRCVRLARVLAVSEPTLLEDLMPSLGLEGHPQVLSRCEAAAALPEAVLAFCEAKGFSLKQCAQLCRYPTELLSTVLSWRHRLSLTASVLRELLENIHDFLRAHDLDPAAFANRSDVSALVTPRYDDEHDSQQHRQQRTQQLRDLVRALRLPTLTEVNQRMDDAVASMGLPAAVTVSWDRTLEHREVAVRLSVSDPRQWRLVLRAAQDEAVERGVCALLAEL